MASEELTTKIAGIADVSGVTDEEIAAIRRNSAFALPNSPAEHGMRAGNVKPAFWRAIAGDTNSVVMLIDRLITDVNGDFTQLRALLSALVEAMDTKDAALGGRIDTEQTARTEGDAALGGRIDKLESIGDATDVVRGYMTPTQVKHLTTLVALLEDKEATIDTIKEVLAAFEGAEIGTNIANTFVKLNAADDAFSSQISKLTEKDTELSGEISTLKSADTTLSTTVGEVQNNVQQCSNNISKTSKDVAVLAERIDVGEKKLANLEARLLPQDFVVNDTTAYQKTVPATALPYASIDKIGGAFAPENLFVTLGAIDRDNEQTDGEFMTLEFDESDESVMYIVGDGDSGDFDYGFLGRITLPNGQYTLSCFVDNPDEADAYLCFTYYDDETGSDASFVDCASDTPATFDVEDGERTFNIEVSLSSRIFGELANRKTKVKIMLTKGSVAYPHIPKGAYNQSAKVTEVVSESGNLIPFPYATNDNYLENGIAYNVLTDRKICVNGTSTGLSKFELARDVHLEPGQYTLIGTPQSDYGTDVSLMLAVLKNSGDMSYVFNSSATPKTFAIEQGDVVKVIRVQIYKGGITVENLIFEPMLVKGDVAPSDYQPYGVLDTLQIPAEVQALPGYGEANPDNPDEANYVDFEAQKFVAYGYMRDGVWVAHHSPVETDISAYDNFIRVGGAGTLTFKNEHGFAVPSTVTYQQEVTE